MRGRTKFAVGIAALAGTLFMGTAPAEDFPAHPLRLIMPYAAGSSSDVTVRLIANRVEPQLKQTIVIENRPGANALIGAAFVAKAPADGYTLLFTVPPAVSKIYFRNPGFDVRSDMVAVTGICATPYVLAVNSGVPAKSLAEFVSYAKANAGKLNYGDSANSTMLSMELFKSVAGLDVVVVPYKGAAPATQALVAGEIQALFGLVSSFKALEDAGKVRMLASTFPRRLAAWPNMPTFAELGYPDEKLTVTTTLLERRGAPPQALEKLALLFKPAVAAPEVVKVCTDAGGEPVTADMDQLQRSMGEEIDRWTFAASRARFVPQD